jgi:hypothetical protein
MCSEDCNQGKNCSCSEKASLLGPMIVAVMLAMIFLFV